MIHIIDDEEVCCDVLVRFIDLLGLPNISFSSPVEYLEFVYSKAFVPPQVILTDMRMPEMNGYDMMERVYRLYPETSFVVISGESDFSHPMSCKASMFLNKPYRFQEIKEIVSYSSQTSVQCPIV